MLPCSFKNAYKPFIIEVSVRAERRLIFDIYSLDVRNQALLQRALEAP
jgi:hypothetical protein